MSLFVYSLILFFGWYLVNRADITKSIMAWILPRLHPKVQYAISCGLCWAFWWSIVAWLFATIPFVYIFAAPVLNLFLVRLYHFLSMEVHSSQ